MPFLMTKATADPLPTAQDDNVGAGRQLFSGQILHCVQDDSAVGGSGECGALDSGSIVGKPEVIGLLQSLPFVVTRPLRTFI